MADQERVVKMAKTEYGKKIEKLIKSLDNFAADIIKNTQKVVEAARELKRSVDKEDQSEDSKGS